MDVTLYTHAARQTLGLLAAGVTAPASYIYATYTRVLGFSVSQRYRSIVLIQFDITPHLGTCLLLSAFVT